MIRYAINEKEAQPIFIADIDQIFDRLTRYVAPICAHPDPCLFPVDLKQ